MRIIKPYGSFFKNNEQGEIINMTHRAFILPPWTEAVSAIQTAYLEKYEHHIHSIYLRGSVPRGLAIQKVSDVDSFAILQPDSAHIRDAQGEFNIEKKLGEQFPFTTRIEFYTLPYAKVIAPSSAHPFNIKINSLCLWGHNLSEDIPSFMPGKTIAFFAQHYAKQLTQFQQRYPTLNTATQLKDACAWIMKRTVRSGFDLVMEKIGKYTRDLYPCYQGFSDQYPQHEPQMRQALTWAIAPTSNMNSVNIFVKTFCIWLRDEIEACLG